MRRLPIALTLAFMLAPRDASADDAVRRADQLFREAKALTDAGQYPPACPKLEESERLDPALGTEFNLADCYEHTDRRAKAYKLFRAVADAAHVAGKDARERAAKARADALEPLLATARIKFATGSPPAGARITLDGAEIQDPGSAQVIEPGHHVLQVSGAGVDSWSTDVTATARQTIDIAVPDLAIASPPPPPPETPPPRREPPGISTGRIVAYALGGGAVVALGVGAIAGELSVTQHDSAHAVCPVPNPCGDAHAASTWTHATTAGSISTVGFVSAGVLTAAAVVVWIASPATANASASGRVTSLCGARGCSLELRF